MYIFLYKKTIAGRNKFMKNIRFRILLCFLAMILQTGCCSKCKSPHPDLPENFHKVSENIYRSGQPDADEFESLYTIYGIRSVLNLRKFFSDKDEIDAVNRKWNNALVLYEIPLLSSTITENDLCRILTVIRDARKPLLIHCYHGSNRTGSAISAYRIVFENRSIEDAIRELHTPEYGHSKMFYSNIGKLLRKADWQKIKTTVLNQQK